MKVEFKRNDPGKARQYFSDKLAFTTGPAELFRYLKDGGSVTVIDVRSPEAYGKAHVPGAINLPKEKWETEEGLCKEGLNVLYGYTQQCHLAAAAAVEFADRGYSVMEMEGGFEAWREYNFEMELGMSPENRWKHQAISA
jgi:rhodanese-related sulfurtransferase